MHPPDVAAVSMASTMQWLVICLRFLPAKMQAKLPAYDEGSWVAQLEG